MPHARRKVMSLAALMGVLVLSASVAMSASDNIKPAEPDVAFVDPGAGTRGSGDGSGNNGGLWNWDPPGGFSWAPPPPPKRPSGVTQEKAECLSQGRTIGMTWIRTHPVVWFYALMRCR